MSIEATGSHDENDQKTKDLLSISELEEQIESKYARLTNAWVTYREIVGKKSTLYPPTMLSLPERVNGGFITAKIYENSQERSTVMDERTHEMLGIANDFLPDIATLDKANLEPAFGQDFYNSDQTKKSIRIADLLLRDRGRAFWLTLDEENYKQFRDKVKQDQLPIALYSEQEMEREYHDMKMEPSVHSEAARLTSSDPMKLVDTTAWGRLSELYIESHSNLSEGIQTIEKDYPNENI